MSATPLYRFTAAGEHSVGVLEAHGYERTEYQDDESYSDDCLKEGIRKC